MAERRMFAKTIIDSDAFLDMPLSAQALYFHLSMRADDDGFVNNPKKVQRMVGASDDDCKLLVMKRFILTFESGIIVIKHWKIHNYIQKDRYKETVYLQEKSTLALNENKAYTECIQNGYNVDTQVSIELGKDSIEIEKDNMSGDIAEIISYLNEKTNSNYKTGTPKTRTLIKARLNEGFSVDDFKSVIDKKVAEWQGTEMEQYLRPETLFGTKFEGYLNTKTVATPKRQTKEEETTPWDDLV